MPTNRLPDHGAPHRATRATDERTARCAAGLALLLALPLAGTVLADGSVRSGLAAPGAVPTGAARTDAAPNGTPRAGTVKPWTDAPLETLGEDHRVREGHVGAAEDIAADAVRAAAGLVVGAAPAYEALRRVRPAAASAAADPYPTYVDPYGEATWIADIGVLLRGDGDGDGFYGSVDLAIDVDTDGVERDVYAVVELTEPGGALTLRHTSATFTVRGRATSDEYRIEIELLDDHFADYRDVRIEIRDAWRDDLLDQATPWTFASLSGLPLEADRGTGSIRDDGYHDPYGDTAYGLGVVFTGGSSHHDRYYRDNGFVAAHYAAGAAGPLGTLALLALLGGRRLAARRRRARSL